MAMCSPVSSGSATKLTKSGRTNSSSALKKPTAIWPERTPATKTAPWRRCCWPSWRLNAKRWDERCTNNSTGLFIEYGCHVERTISHTMPGADGLAKMKTVMKRLRHEPAEQARRLIGASSARLSAARNHKSTGQRSIDLRSAARRKSRRRAPSGTEPKLKFYLFASEPPQPAADLPDIKQLLAKRLDAIEADLWPPRNDALCIVFVVGQFNFLSRVARPESATGVVNGSTACAPRPSPNLRACHPRLI